MYEIKFRTKSVIKDISYSDHIHTYRVNVNFPDTFVGYVCCQPQYSYMELNVT